MSTHFSQVREYISGQRMHLLWLHTGRDGMIDSVMVTLCKTVIHLLSVDSSRSPCHQAQAPQSPEYYYSNIFRSHVHSPGRLWDSAEASMKLLFINKWRTCSCSWNKCSMKHLLSFLNPGKTTLDLYGNSRSITAAVLYMGTAPWN